MASSLPMDRSGLGWVPAVAGTTVWRLRSPRLNSYILAQGYPSTSLRHYHP